MHFLNQLTRIAAFTSIIMALGCNQEAQQNTATVSETYQALKNSINPYLIKDQGAIGFGGEVVCNHHLIGENDQQFFIAFKCVELYQVDNDSIAMGTGMSSYAVVEHDNTNLKNIITPRDGSAYTHDLERLFPPDIADKIQEKQYLTEEMKRTDQLFWEQTKMTYQKKFLQNRAIFDSLLSKKIKADFEAAGAEPFWTMYLLDNQMLLMNPMILSKYQLLDKFDPALTEQQLRFVNNISDTLKINILKEDTFEEMSNKKYPYRVQITMNNNIILKGVSDYPK